MATLTSVTFQAQKYYESPGYGGAYFDFVRKISRIKKGVTPTVRDSNHNVIYPSNIDYDTGIFTFSGAPSAPITGIFTFDIPMRFDTDFISASFEDYVQRRASVPLVELKY